MPKRWPAASLALIVLAVPPAGAQDRARPKTLDLRNEVEGKRTIFALALEGTAVKKGDLVAELDVADLLRKQDAQRIAGDRAAARLDEARKARDAAVETLRQYVEGGRQQDIQSARAQIALVKEDRDAALLRRDKLKKDEAERPESLRQAELQLQKATIALMEAQTKLMVLEKFTGVKTIAELESSVEAASSELSRLEADQAVQDQIEAKLRRQIEKRYLHAHVDGTVVHVHEPTPVREGDTVYERQTIVRILPAAEGEPGPPR